VRITKFGTALGRRAGLSGGTVVSWLLLFSGLSGCSYLEGLLQRSPPIDNRVELGWQERRSLSVREIPNYRCDGDHFLQCERGGAITYSCTCALY